MYCTIESNEFNNTIVKIRFESTRYIHFFPFYKISDYVECFIREKDLSNPKVVVLYK